MEMVVRRIVTQHDRVLFYGDDDDYAVIANKVERGVSVGDRIKFEPYGVNFGFMKQ